MAAQNQTLPNNELFGDGDFQTQSIRTDQKAPSQTSVFAYEGWGYRGDLQILSDEAEARRVFSL